MTAVGQWRATYAPGDWLVLCGPTSVVVLEPPGAGWTSLAAELWSEVLASASIVELAARLGRYGLDTMPSFGALFWTPDGMRSLVRGGVTLVDTATGDTVASGAGVQTWSEAGLGRLTQVRIDTGVTPDPDALQLPLVVGAVRASYLLLDASVGALAHSPQLDPPADQARPEPREPDAELPLPTSRTERLPAEPEDGESTEPVEQPTPAPAPPSLAPAPPSPAAAPEPTVALPGVAEMENADTELWQPVDLPPPPATGSPTVMAVLCPSGHPNPPGAHRCSDCGVRITDPRPRPVPQPALATLRVTDGSHVLLDRVVLVGRAPVDQGSAPAHLLTVPSPAHDISRTHLQVAPEGWRILVQDLHSTNGTVVVAPDGRIRRALPAGEPVAVELGSVIELAEGISVLLDLPS